MLVFATSDKGGTGRTVTTSNIAYRHALRGGNVCYVDFDFGSPTAGAVFQISAVARGTLAGGLHSYVQGAIALPAFLDVWSESEHPGVRLQPAGAGSLTLFPGDEGGGEFSVDVRMVRRCVDLFLRLEEEYELVLVDLSAGRSYAVDAALAATADPALRAVVPRWMVFHRWTHQHIVAAADLVHGERGIIRAGVLRGHDADVLARSVRFVRTAVVDPNSDDLAGLRPAQIVWLRQCDEGLRALAGLRGLGNDTMLGAVPLDPVLQWQEQLLTDDDTLMAKVANEATVAAFTRLADRLTDDAAWGRR